MNNGGQLRPEQLVFDRKNGTRYRVIAPLDLTTILVREIDNPNEDKTIHKLVTELVADTSGQSTSYDISEYDADSWNEAIKRMDAIRPIIHPAGAYKELTTTERVKKRSEEIKVGVASLYRWISSWRDSGNLHSLVPKKRGPKDVNSRISAQTNAIIDSVINEEYLTPRKPRASYIIQEVNRRCHNAGADFPHGNTVRNRLKKVSERLQVQRRFGNKAAKARYQASSGHYPVDAPYACYQIDHTPLDMTYVHEHDRLPAGRPYLTLITDVYTRMIAGFYLSADTPSFVSVGMALINAILPKDTYLSDVGVEGVWPVQGTPNKISIDNAKEFRGNSLQRACENFGIDIEWRPVGRPEFGGNVERVIGALNQIMHSEPGTTKSSISERGEYDSSKEAIYTLQDLEGFLAEAIVNLYHHIPHSTIQQKPIDRFDDAIFGNSNKPGIGLRMSAPDPVAVKINFLPSELRTVQRGGIQWDIHYYHDTLRPWINAKDPSDTSKKREFIIRRDPRDISRIFFWDPELKEHFEIPARETSIPRMSIYELRELRKIQREEGQQSLDESQIYGALNNLRERRAKASAKTQSERRRQSRNEFHGQQVNKLGIPSKNAQLSDSKPESSEFDELFNNVKPFDAE